MNKKHGEEEPEPKKTHVTPKKTHAHTSKVPSVNTSIPSMTEEQIQAYIKFSDACKKVYKEFSKGEIDIRVLQLKSSPALIVVVRFIVMVHDLLKMYGVMQFNKHVSPILYKYLAEIQEQTGQKLPLARVLLDGIKTTKMELLSGVTIHPLPEFEEPEYETMTTSMPDPIDEEFEPQDQDVPGDQEQHVGPGGPAFDESVQPESGTPVDQVSDPPASVHEEEPLPEEPGEVPPEEPLEELPEELEQ